MAIPDIRLRLLTLNTQLMYVPFHHSKDGVEQTAHQVAASLRRDRWADVLCLNEVFDEDCRAHLIAELTPLWPFVAKKFGPQRSFSRSDELRLAGAVAAWLATNHPGSALLALGIDALADWLATQMSLPEDSGLMVFSRYPIITQDFASYSAGAYVDWMADKGVAYVAIDRSPNCEAHIFLSHTQASYDTAEQYADVRQEQLRQAAEFIEALAPPDSDQKRVITAFCGDLNVHGDVPPRPEWERVFIQGQATTFYSTGAWDAWDHFVSPEGGRVTDPGLTNRGDGRESRLDYVVLRRSAAVERPEIVAQRMSLAQQGVADHIGVRAELNVRSPHCYPADALPVNTSVGNLAPIDLDHGGLFWLYFPKGGTWSICDGPETQHQIYSTRDISHVIGPRRYTDLSQIPHAAPAIRFEGADPGSSTYSIPGDFLVMVQRRDDETGPVGIGWYRHLGTSPEDAILLLPQHPPAAPDFDELAAASVHGAMEFWFEATWHATRNNDPLTWRFRLHNQTGESLDLTVFQQSSGALLGQLTDTAQVAELQIGSTTPLTVQAAVRLDRPDQHSWGLSMRSPLTFLTESGRRLELVCVDETGPDWAGNDEIMMTMRPDALGGKIDLLNHTTNVFTGRRIPLSSADNGNWTSTQTAYRWHLETTLTETETILDDDVATRLIPALADDAYHEQHTITFKPGSGTYTLDVHLAREPGPTFSPPQP